MFTFNYNCIPSGKITFSQSIKIFNTYYVPSTYKHSIYFVKYYTVLIKTVCPHRSYNLNLLSFFLNCLQIYLKKPRG